MNKQNYCSGCHWVDFNYTSNKYYCRFAHHRGFKETNIQLNLSNMTIPDWCPLEDSDVIDVIENSSV